MIIFSTIAFALSKDRADESKRSNLHRLRMRWLGVFQSVNADKIPDVERWAYDLHTAANDFV